MNHTDFLNNYIGVYDYFKNVARAGEGVHYCTFGTDASTKYPDPTNSASAGGTTGIHLSYADQALGYNNYAAASIDHCSFHHLDVGIFGTAQQLRIMDNSFDYIWRAALDLETSNGAGFFTFTPMYVQRNNFTLRGTNPLGYLSTYGIMGGVYAQGNYFQGDASNPASNGVEQVGIWMGVPDNSTQTDNTFERLDKGIEASVDNWLPNAERDISGNMFRDVRNGVSFYNNLVSPIPSSNLHIRCNSFENPGNLAGAVALNILGPGFPTELGSSANGNGNRFVTPGLPFIEPIANNSNIRFVYYAFGSSTQEAFPAITALTYTVSPTGGNPAMVCTGAGYTNGIYSRGTGKLAPPLLEAAALQNAYDSLRLPLPAARRNALLNTVITAITQRNEMSGLETYLSSLPIAANEAHAALGSWLLQTHRLARRDSDAKRLRALLLARHVGNAEVQSFVQLSDVQARLAQATDPLASPTPADVAALKAVAASGTAAARVACPAARRYDPACPCRFSIPVVAKALGARGSLLASGKGQALGALYPNPTSGAVRVPYALPLGADLARLELRNALGQVVQRVNLTGSVGEALLDVRPLSAGLYSCVLVVSGRICEARRLAVTK